MKQFRSNVLIGVFFLFCFLGIDRSVKWHNPHFFLESSLIPLLLISLTLTFLVKNKNLLIIWALMLIALFIQLVHFEYFGAPIAATDITVFFTHNTDVMESFGGLAILFIMPFLICIFSFVIIYYAIKKLPNRTRWEYAWILLLIEFCAPFAFSFTFHFHHGVRNNPNHSIGEFPSAAENLWISSEKTILFYFTYTLPHQFFLKGELIQPIHPAYAIAVPHPDINIIFIMGESLTNQQMSSYGYARQTTPFLDALKNQQQAIFKYGISGGVSTDISLSSFFNMISRPDGTRQISTKNTNLFKMAKQNGFETYFISAQARYCLNIVKNYLLPRFIDHYADSSFFGASYRKDVLDSELVKYFQKTDLNKPVFMVLHQKGSHFPYNMRYPLNFEFYATTPDDSYQQKQMNRYDNSVRYTDSNISALIKLIIQKSSRPTYLIFTSDHGESLGEEGIYGHNNVQIKVQHLVPIIFIGLNGANLNFLN